MHILKNIALWTSELTISCGEAKLCHTLLDVFKIFSFLGHTGDFYSFFWILESQMSSFRFVIISHVHFNLSLLSFTHRLSHDPK